MLLGRTTLSKFLIEAGGTTELAALLVDVAAAVKQIAAIVAKGALGGRDEQRRLDALAHDAVIQACEWSGLTAGLASGGVDAPCAIPAEYRRGPLLLVFQPLDGIHNTDLNMALGTLFSVFRHDGGEAPPATGHYLQSGRRQLAAGYAIYGPATMLVLTIGRGTHGFTLDRETGNFILTHPNLRIPEETAEFAIDSSQERFWEPPVQRYVAECKAGRAGARQRDFQMRWNACLVAEVHRILMRGGVLLKPRLQQPDAPAAALRLLFDVNPMALLVEQAGGCASTGRGALLDLSCHDLQQCAPLIVGSRHEVERVERYHAEHDRGADVEYRSPLFNERSLFRPEMRVGAGGY
jgi:fructose-1,6-bisphosphatase I/sedoheptulose-1,7-bisphosphatase